MHFDSKLVEGQVSGEYAAKEDRMKEYLDMVKNLISGFNKFEIRACLVSGPQ